VFECWEVEEDEVPTVDKLLGSSYRAFPLDST